MAYLLLIDFALSRKNDQRDNFVKNREMEFKRIVFKKKFSDC